MTEGCFAGAGKMSHDEALESHLVISSEGEAGVEKSAAQPAVAARSDWLLLTARNRHGD